MAAFNGFGEKAIPFLKALNFHQSREWFQENRDLFEQELREPLGDLVDVLSERFAAAGLKLKGDRKKSQFRINRDVRFSKDKRPYTDHVSAILSPDGTKTEQGVFFRLWKEALREYDELEGIDWGWQSLDGAMTKAPLGGEKNRPESDGPRQVRHEAFPSYGWRRRTARAGRGGRQRA